MDNNRFKTTFQLCLPIMVLCGMWVISNLFYLYALLMYPAYYRDLELIDFPIPFVGGMFSWHYPTPNRFSFYFFVCYYHCNIRIMVCKEASVISTSGLCRLMD